MVEGDGLENRYTPRGYRGFESLALRHFYFKQKMKMANEAVRRRLRLWRDKQGFSSLSTVALCEGGTRRQPLFT